MCSLLIIWQSFSIYVNKGNLSFTICNESGIDSAVIEIYIDGHKVNEQNLHYYTFYSTYISPKNHVVVIKINEEISQEIQFNTVLFTRIYIDYQGDDSNSGHGTRFYFSISKWPIQFLV